jgi:hypothetical protein
MRKEVIRMDDFFDDDYIEDDFGENFDDGLEIVEDNTAHDIEQEEPLEPGISFDDFLFWGGFLGINIDEEREERRRKKKKREISDPEDDFKKKDYF